MLLAAAVSPYPALQFVETLKNIGLLDTGAAIMAVLFIFGLQRNWWVMGQRYAELREDRDRWRELYLREHGRKCARAAQ